MMKVKSNRSKNQSREAGQKRSKNRSSAVCVSTATTVIPTAAVFQAERRILRADKEIFEMPRLLLACSLLLSVLTSLASGKALPVLAPPDSDRITLSNHAMSATWSGRYDARV
jgi:hypothetical protein